MNGLETLKRFRETIQTTTDMYELLLIADATGSLYAHLLERVKPGLSEPKKKDLQKPKKRCREERIDIDDNEEERCPGPYWRTQEIVQKLKQVNNELINGKKNKSGRRHKIHKYICTGTLRPRYKGPHISVSATAKRICNTCYNHYKKDVQKNLLK